MARNDLGSLLDGLLDQGGESDGPSGGALLGALLMALGDGSGGRDGNALSVLLDMLTEAGLAEEKESWIGAGENRPVTGAQILQALPEDTLKQVAEQTGVTPDRAATEISQVLPLTVDRLTPDGRIPSGSLEDAIRRQSA
ncbi:DUF937 domain-containing protein [Streptomyces phyllanthi]|uniref:DUF937 domain-containing protein n=2 Tax=Streptomyces phyllanthi TaxID=1803180 RepID=A0A5N8W300_9ACTN|nr:YidB family protein [Streptomyces phyllanthi]MPY40674.1 DUF937 domain-containing protein [Streptomyces phyllanthi]